MRFDAYVKLTLIFTHITYIPQLYMSGSAKVYKSSYAVSSKCKFNISVKSHNEYFPDNPKL